MQGYIYNDNNTSMYTYMIMYDIYIYIRNSRRRYRILEMIFNIFMEILTITKPEDHLVYSEIINCILI